jgi:hypothetical protein
MAKWEYLLTHPYQARLRLAEHFLLGCDVVVDVGSYVYQLDLPEDTNLVSLDPIGSIPNSIRATASEWWTLNKPRGRFGLSCLGFAIEGPKYEWDAVLEMAQAADVVVVEWATEYEPLWGEPATLLVGKRTVFHAAMTLPDTPTPGFPVFEKRMIMVGEK